MQTSQEHFTTIVSAKFGGQTECIIGNLKIENTAKYFVEIVMFYAFCKGTYTLCNKQEPVDNLLVKGT